MGLVCGGGTGREVQGGRYREGGTGREVQGGRYREGGTGREVGEGGTEREVLGGGEGGMYGGGRYRDPEGGTGREARYRGKGGRRGATLTSLIHYLCIAKVEVDSCGMANVEHTIRLRRESSHHLDWTNRLTAL